MRRRVLQGGYSPRRNRLLCGVALYAMVINCLTPLAAVAADTGSNDANTTTPIKHVIVIIGENRTFDHMFATYAPKKTGETVFNLLSEGIVKADGTPGANYSKVAQVTAQDRVPNPYLLSPPGQTTYTTLPAPLAGGGYTNDAPPFSTVAEAQTYENGLPPSYYKYLTTGGVPGYLIGMPDTRIYYNGKNVNNLPPGPYQLTNTVDPTGPTMSSDDYVESPAHRFYQMWQELNCTAAMGCQNTLFPWVEATVGAGSKRQAPAGELHL
jgi:phospholipase C